jgi:hypothetical protein
MEYSPHRLFGILDRAHFPHKGCRSGETHSILNGTPGKVMYLCQEDRLGVSPTKVLGTRHREKSMRMLFHPISGFSR